MLGGRLLSLMPTSSSSFSSSALQKQPQKTKTKQCHQHWENFVKLGISWSHFWTSPLVASSIIMIMSAVFPTEITWRPRPLPFSQRRKNTEPEQKKERLNILQAIPSKTPSLKYHHTLRSTFNDSREIQDLDVSSIVLHTKKQHLQTNPKRKKIVFECQLITLSFPGIQVRVVNSYAAATLAVSVSFVSMVDLPTEGNPIKATRASPDFITSNPSPYKERNMLQHEERTLEEAPG